MSKKFTNSLKKSAAINRLGGLMADAQSARSAADGQADADEAQPQTTPLGGGAAEEAAVEEDEVEEEKALNLEAAMHQETFSTRELAFSLNKLEDSVETNTNNLAKLTEMMKTMSTSIKELAAASANKPAGP